MLCRAVCVTNLSVLDTWKHSETFGKLQNGNKLSSYLDSDYEYYHKFNVFSPKIPSTHNGHVWS
jgi:hypothetical protein